MALAVTIKEQDTVSELFDHNSQEHSDHHTAMRDFLPLLIEFLEDRKVSQKRWEQIRDTAVATITAASVAGVLSFIGWLAHLAWLAVRVV